MDVTRDHVAGLARLARLHLDDGEIESLTAELSRFLDSLTPMESLDLDGVEPALYPWRGVDSLDPASLRADEKRAGLSAEEALQNAPARHDTYFLVPAVMEEETP